MDFLKDGKKFIFPITYAIVLYLALTHLSSFSGVVDYVVDVSFPILLGFAIAYVLNIPMRHIESKVINPGLEKLHMGHKKSLVRSLSILSVFALAALAVTGLILFVMPQIVASIRSLSVMIQYNMNTAGSYFFQLMEDMKISDQMIQTIQAYWKEILDTFGNYLWDWVPKIITFTTGLTSSITTMILAIIMSIYMLASKERMRGVLTSMMKAYLPKRTCVKIMEVFRIANRAFSKYVSGQVIEAFIIGVLCFAGMTVLKMPYSFIISVFVGVTGLIPMFGAFIGAALGAFLIAMISPWQAVGFLVFIVVLQQVEGNVIYPRVVGNSLGLRGIYVMLAIIIGGNLFGFPGMILGIPVFATIYTLVKKDVAKRTGEPLEEEEPTPTEEKKTEA